MSTREGSRTLLEVAGDALSFLALLFALAVVGAALLGGCASKPISVEVENGLLEIEGVGKVTGDKIRYRSGLLEAGETAATFDGEASGFPAAGPAPTPTQ